MVDKKPSEKHYYLIVRKLRVTNVTDEVRALTDKLSVIKRQENNENG